MNPALAEPVAAEERIGAMDALRGFALLGVAIINMHSFIGPLERLWEPWATFRWLQFLLLTLVQGKFYGLFSLLFGMGFAVQFDRLKARGVDAAHIYRRRMTVLFLLGLAHGAFVWMGDILLPYALFGFVLLAFHPRQDRALIRWAVALVIANTLLALLMAGALALLNLTPEGHRQMLEETAKVNARAAQSILAYSQGPYGALFKARLHELTQNYAMGALFAGPQILGFFLLGAWAGRQGLLKDPAAHAPMLRRVAAWGLGLGLPLNMLYAIVALNAGMPGPANPVSMLAMCVFLPSAPLLVAGVAAAFALLPPRLSFLHALAPMGRMALTNYLAHSLVFTSVFYFWGTGRYGSVPMWVATPLAIAVWLLQMGISKWWLRRFRMGPFEWVWRSLTYGAMQRLR